MTKKALILVDLQNDFCQGGALAAPDGDAVIPVANRLQPLFDVVVATQDWHPQNHSSFASMHPGFNVGDVIELHKTTQILWPDHCVQGSHGAEFHPDLNMKKVHKIVLKGVDPAIDSYSAFFDNAHLRSTGLTDYLREQGVEEVYIMGLVTEFCVKFSVVDAVQEGFKVTLVTDGCRGVNLHPDDIPVAINEMKNLGVKFVSSAELLQASQ